MNSYTIYLYMIYVYVCIYNLADQRTSVDEKLSAPCWEYLSRRYVALTDDKFHSQRQEGGEGGGG